MHLCFRARCVLWGLHFWEGLRMQLPTSLHLSLTPFHHFWPLWSESQAGCSEYHKDAARWQATYWRWRYVVQSLHNDFHEGGSLEPLGRNLSLVDSFSRHSCYHAFSQRLRHHHITTMPRRPLRQIRFTRLVPVWMTGFGHRCGSEAWHFLAESFANEKGVRWLWSQLLGNVEPLKHPCKSQMAFACHEVFLAIGRARRNPANDSLELCCRHARKSR